MGALWVHNETYPLWIMVFKSVLTSSPAPPCQTINISTNVDDKSLNAFQNTFFMNMKNREIPLGCFLCVCLYYLLDPNKSLYHYLTLWVNLTLVRILSHIISVFLVFTENCKLDACEKLAWLWVYNTERRGGVKE